MVKYLSQRYIKFFFLQKNRQMFTYIILYFKENLAKNNKIYYFCKHNAKQ